MTRKTAIIVKGYPRLSETFILRELMGLQERGVTFLIVSLRHPTESRSHTIVGAIDAPVLYLPEYLHDEVLRVLRAFFVQIVRNPCFWRLMRLWLRDFRRDPSINRARRLGQACVLACELPDSIGHLYVHYLHTPASVARYAAILRGIGFSISAHAKDVWTIPDWEKREKLGDASWVTTCTRLNADHLRELAPNARVMLNYHGIDAAFFTRTEPPDISDGWSGDAPVRIVTVARAVEKKGLDTLIEALARLPGDLQWRWDHVGGGALTGELKEQAAARCVSARITWHGSLDANEVKAVMEKAAIFCLPARIARDGDRDGLPNALIEAMAMELAIVSTPVSAIPEIIENGHNGVLVEPDDAHALGEALQAMIGAPDTRTKLGRSARKTVDAWVSADKGYDELARLLKQP